MRRRSALRAALLLGAWAFAAVPSGGAAGDPGTLVGLALDTSGSVGPHDLARARDLALSILAALPPGSEVAVLAFDDQSRLIVPRTSRPEDVRRRLARLEVGGRYTALHDALYDASRYLRDAPAARKAIVLITDGHDENSALNLDDGLRLAQDARIPVYAIGVGRVEARTLRRIAKLTSGEYLSLAQARGSGIASRIAAQEANPAPVRAQGAPTPLEPTPATGAPTKSAPLSPSVSRAPASIAPPSREVTGGTGFSWLLVWVAVAVVALAGAVVFLARRRPAMASAPRSGFEEPAEESDDESSEQLSPTLLSRMNTTEEYLEKTVALRARPMLSVFKGPSAGQVLELSDESATSIGRAKANDLQIDDLSVSSQHCRIRPENDHFVIHDLKSTNGTYVNEKRVARHVLHEGDVIKIGESQIAFKLDLLRA